MTALAAAPRLRARPHLPVALLGVALVVSMAAALVIGSVHVPLSTVLEVVGRRVGLGDFAVDVIDDRIVWQMRLPRVLGAAAVGAGLAIVGVVLQSITRNDLADPYLLGISQGATVGAVSVLVLGFGAGLAATTALTLGAFAGALAALVVVLVVAAGRRRVLTPARTVLAGVAVGQVCSAYASFTVILSDQHDAARRVLSWTLGSVAGVRWGSAAFLLIVAVLTVVGLWTMSSALDAFAFGEVAASALGISVAAFRWIILASTALVVAALVSFSGAIGFVGLVVPHVMRLFFGPRHVVLLPASALGGAVLLVWADLVARTMIPGQELPVGVVTAAVGAPLFAYLLWRGASS